MTHVPNDASRLLSIRTFTRHIRNQPSLERRFLDLTRHRARIDNEAVYLNEPEQRVVLQPAWETPLRIEPAHFQHIGDRLRFVAAGTLRHTEQFAEFVRPQVRILALVKEKVGLPEGIDDSTRP